MDRTDEVGKEGICSLIDTRMNDIALKINKTYSIFEADKLHSELRILDWILYQVCRNEIKNLELDLKPNGTGKLY